jgi:hypothetical protein
MTFGADSFGSLPWGANEPTVRLSEVTAYLESQAVRTSFMARLNTATASTVTTRYVSDGGYLTDEFDSIPDRAWPARIVGFQWRRSFLGANIGGESSVRSARITIDNTDATPWRGILNGEAVDDRQQDVWFGDPSFRSNQLIRIFSGTGSGFERGRLDEVVIGLKGLDAVFDQPMQTNTYAGTGDQEGGADLEGKDKVIALGGVIKHVPPPRLTNLNVYDLHNDVDGNGAQIQSVDAVYDRGVELARADSGNGAGDFDTYADLKNATTGNQGSGADIESGEFATCLAEGFLRLGTEADGQLTVDMKGGHFFGDGFQALPGEMARVVTQHYTGLSGGKVNLADFDNLNTDWPYNLGRWIGPEGATRRQIMDEIAQSVFGYWGSNSLGVIQIAEVRKPTGSLTGERTFTEKDLTSVARAAKPSDIDPAVDRVTVGYRRSYTVQTSDLDANITDATRDFIQQRWRTLEATIDPSPYKITKQVRINSLHTTESGATDLRDTVKSFYNPVPFFYTLTTDHRAIDLGLNRLITVTDEEAGLSDDVLTIGGISVGIDSDGSPRVQLTCYGNVSV